MNHKELKRLPQHFLPLLASLIGILVFYSIRELLLLLCIATGMGIIHSALLEILQNQLKLSRAVSVTLLIFLWAIALTGTITFFIYLTQSELKPFLEKLPTLTLSGKTFLVRLFHQFPALSHSIESSDWSILIQKFLGKAFEGVSRAGKTVAFIAYTFSVSIYTALHSGRYRESLLSLIPKIYHERAQLLLNVILSTFENWFLAQLIAMIAVGSLASLGFLLLRSPYWLSLGIITAVLDIVPFLGPTLAALIAIFITLGSHPQHVFWVVLLFVIIENIESHLILPLILKEKTEVPPVYLLTAILIFGQWFGFLGVLAAPPLTCMARTLYLHLYIPWINHEEILPLPAPPLSSGSSSSTKAA